MKYVWVMIICCWVMPNLFSQNAPWVKVIPDENKKKVDILIYDKLFTAYIFPDDIMKPVLWPVMTSQENEITRSFPLKSKAGERVDHPHHVGVWFNYGDVNGLDFWNNSQAIKAQDIYKYGFIEHQNILKYKSKRGKGILKTTAKWKDSFGTTLLDEKIEFRFLVEDGVRIIDRKSTLVARSDEVLFKDNKEGMFAIRVARELELPSEGALKLSDTHGNITEVSSPDNSLVSGNYLSSKAITGSKVWGTRAKWMKLYGIINGEKVAVVIYDHPDNVGYPTYWHARTYGLFSANTLGQKVFSNGEKELNFTLKNKEKAIFRYRLAVFSGDPSVKEIETLSKSFSKIK